MLEFAALGSARSADLSIPPRPAIRGPRTALGIAQLPDEKLDWLLDAKFGMFIHWGIYCDIGKGEWYMENKGVLPDDYRKDASPQSKDAIACSM